MINNLTNPCKECPFRKDSIKGWLGGPTPEMTVKAVLNEADFACHLTRHKKKENMSRCRGSMLFLIQSMKVPKYNTPLVAATKELRIKDIENILSVKEFYLHHEI